jgi:hypothetical protein
MRGLYVDEEGGKFLLLRLLYELRISLKTLSDLPAHPPGIAAIDIAL